MIHGFLLAIGTLRAVFLSQADLVLENLALRQQLAAFARNGQRPRMVAADRLFWLALRRLWLRWSDVLVFVKPETVVHTLTRKTHPRMFNPAGAPGPDLGGAVQGADSDPDSCLAYVCGPAINPWDRKVAAKAGTTPTPRFLETSIGYLQRIGVTSSRIKRESYG